MLHDQQERSLSGTDPLTENEPAASEQDASRQQRPVMTAQDHEEEAAAAKEDPQYEPDPGADVGFPQEKIDEALLMQFLAQTVNGTVVQERFRAYAQPYRDMMSYYKCAMMEVATKFNVLDEELGLEYDRNPIESIRTRLKSPESILDKIHRKNVTPTVESIEENIFDIAGIRVVCTFPSDIYTLRGALLKQDDVELIREKDYIAHPKPNGYRSLHLIIQTPIFLHDRKRFMKVEVQLRTLAMDWWASTEHKVRYKKDIVCTPQMEQELLECADTAALLDQKMDRLHRMTEKKRDDAEER